MTPLHRGKHTSQHGTRTGSGESLSSALRTRGRAKICSAVGRSAGLGTVMALTRSTSSLDRRNCGLMAGNLPSSKPRVQFSWVVGKRMSHTSSNNDSPKLKMSYGGRLEPA